MQDDLTFFTNEPGATVLDRFRKTLKDVQFFDVLVGINIDKTAFEIIESSKSKGKLDFESHKRTKEVFSDDLASEMEHSEDTYDTEIMEQVPIFPASDNQKAPIIDLVKKILTNPDNSDVSRLEAEINKLVYELYDLTPEEIEIMEGL